MNEIKIKVKFKKGLCYSQGIKLVQNDYNSTKLVFEFDDEEGTKIFELRDSDDNVILADEIVNNELILARFDEHDNAYPIFTKEGEYVYEISLYKDNSKLTSASDKFKVNAEQVVIDGEIVETYTPMFDNLLSDLSSALQETDNIDIDVNKVGNTATVSITKKDGTEKSVEIYDGLKGDTGDKGADAKINGVNTLTIEAGTNITLDQEGNTLTINSTASGGSSDYEELANLPQINGVELTGNKSLNDLGIQPEGDYALESDIPDVSNFITKDVDNLTYYTKSTDMQTAINNAVGTEITARENADNSLQNQIDAITVSSDVVDVVSTYQDLVDYDTSHIKANDIIKVMQDSTHDNAISYYRWVIVNYVGSWVYVGSEGPYYTKSETDILLNDKQNTITTTNKLQSDLVDDTNQTNLFVTSAEKTTWDNKLDQSDLADYVKNTDYATSIKSGVFKYSNGAIVGSTGYISCSPKTFADYGNLANNYFISKGTLENVLRGYGLID